MTLFLNFFFCKEANPMNISSVTCFEIYLPNEKQLEKLNEIKKKKESIIERKIIF